MVQAYCWCKHSADHSVEQLPQSVAASEASHAGTIHLQVYQVIAVAAAALVPNEAFSEAAATAMCSTQLLPASTTTAIPRWQGICS
jgi:hypothetical protein